MTMTMGKKTFAESYICNFSFREIIFFSIRLLKSPLVVVSPMASKAFGLGKSVTNNLEQDSVSSLCNTFAY